MDNIQNYCHMMTRRYAVQKTVSEKAVSLKEGHNAFIFLVCSLLLRGKLTIKAGLKWVQKLKEPQMLSWRVMPQRTAQGQGLRVG